MAYGVFGVSNYAGSEIVHLRIKLWPEVPVEEGAGGDEEDTRPPEGKMFPRGK